MTTANYTEIFNFLTTKARAGNTFASSLRDWLDRLGYLTPNQLAAVDRMMAGGSQPQRPEAPAQQVSAGPLLVALQRAKDRGLKRPKIRLGAVVLSLAPTSGNNPGAIYVKRRGGDGAYLGKVLGNRFLSVRGCTESDAAEVARTLENPQAAAEAHGLQSGECAICGRELTDPVSVARGIGPICAENFGW